MLITFDGIDGVGKTTQIQHLTDWLHSRGHRVLNVRDPGSTEIGQQLRSILLDSSLTIHRRTEALLFMASRCEMVETILRPAVAEGKIVIADRFLLANVVYQSVGGDVSSDELWQLGRLACGGVVPDLTILLDLAAEDSLARIDRSADRMEARGLDYLNQVRHRFLSELSQTGGASVRIDASRTIDAIAVEVLQSVQKYFPNL